MLAKRWPLVETTANPVYEVYGMIGYWGILALVVLGWGVTTLLVIAGTLISLWLEPKG